MTLSTKAILAGGAALLALIIAYIRKIQSERKAKLTIVRKKNVMEIMVAREQLKRLQTESTKAREDYKAKREQYDAQYSNKPISISPEPSGSSTSPGPKKL